MNIKMLSIKWRWFCLDINVMIRPLFHSPDDIAVSACVHIFGDMNQIVEITWIYFFFKF